MRCKWEPCSAFGALLNMCGGHIRHPRSAFKAAVLRPKFFMRSIWGLRTPKVWHVVGSETCPIHEGLFSRLDCDANYPSRLFWCEVLNLDVLAEEISVLFFLLFFSKDAQSSKTTTNFNHPTATQNKCHLVPLYFGEDRHIFGWYLRNHQLTPNRSGLMYRPTRQRKNMHCPFNCLVCLDMTLQWLGTEVTLRTCTDCWTLDFTEQKFPILHHIPTSCDFPLLRSLIMNPFFASRPVELCITVTTEDMLAVHCVYYALYFYGLRWWHAWDRT